MQSFGFDLSSIELVSIDVIRFNEKDRYPVSVVKTSQGSFVVNGMNTIKSPYRARHYWTLSPNLRTDTEVGQSLVQNKIAITGNECVERLEKFDRVFFEQLETGEIHLICDSVTQS